MTASLVLLRPGRDPYPDHITVARDPLDGSIVLATETPQTMLRLNRRAANQLARFIQGDTQ